MLGMRRLSPVTVVPSTMGMAGEVGLKERGATVREKMPLDGLRKVGVLGVLCLRSELESYRAGIT